MHLDDEIIAAFANANTNDTTESEMNPETIAMNEQELSPEQEDAQDLAAQSNEAKRIHDATHAASHTEVDDRVAQLFDTYRGLFPEGVRYATTSSITGLAKGVIRQWAWNEVLIRASKNPQTIKDAEVRQARAASLYATYFGMLPKDKRPDIGAAIKVELDRDPDREIGDDENLEATSKVLGISVEQLRKEIPELVAGAQDDSWTKLKKELSKDFVPNLVRQFQHDVAAYGPRPLDLREVSTLVEWTYGSLIGDEEKGFQGLIDRAKLAAVRARTPSRKAEAGGNYRLLTAAAEGLDKLAARCSDLRKEIDGAGYTVEDAWNAMH